MGPASFWSVHFASEAGRLAFGYHFRHRAAQPAMNVVVLERHGSPGPA